MDKSLIYNFLGGCTACQGQHNRIDWIPTRYVGNESCVRAAGTKPTSRPTFARFMQRTFQRPVLFGNVKGIYSTVLTNFRSTFLTSIWHTLIVGEIESQVVALRSLDRSASWSGIKTFHMCNGWPRKCVWYTRHWKTKTSSKTKIQQNYHHSIFRNSKLHLIRKALF